VRFQVVSKGLEISDAIRSYLEKRLEKIDRVVYDEDIVSFNIRIEKDSKNLYSVRFTMNLRGNILNVEENNADLYTAIDLASDALEKQVKKLKERIKGHPKRKEEEGVPQEIGEFSPSDEINDVRRFSLLQLDIDEAVLQMKVMNHRFLVFRNANTGEINLLYRDDAGKLHLLEFSE